MIKKAFLTILTSMIALWAFALGSCLSAQEKPLRIYGPEGPSAPIRECADMFFRVYGTKAEVLTGPANKWVTQAKEDADIIYEETEYMLTQLMSHRP
jgi:accessory colonization factor AcfC